MEITLNRQFRRKDLSVIKQPDGTVAIVSNLGGNAAVVLKQTRLFVK